MSIEALKTAIDEQHKKNKERWGDQEVATSTPDTQPGLAKNGKRRLPPGDGRERYESFGNGREVRQ